MEFTEEQLQRYARHIVLPEVGGVGQEKLLSGKVLVIGAGGLGLTVYVALGRLDIGAAVIGGTGIVILAIVLDRITQKTIKTK